MADVQTPLDVECTNDDPKRQRSEAGRPQQRPPGNTGIDVGVVAPPPSLPGSQAVRLYQRVPRGEDRRQTHAAHKF
jgi:hypothetical protein